MLHAHTQYHSDLEFVNTKFGFHTVLSPVMSSIVRSGREHSVIHLWYRDVIHWHFLFAQGRGGMVCMHTQYYLRLPQTIDHIACNNSRLLSYHFFVHASQCNIPSSARGSCCTFRRGHGCMHTHYTIYSWNTVDIVKIDMAYRFPFSMPVAFHS